MHTGWCGSWVAACALVAALFGCSGDDAADSGGGGVRDGGTQAGSGANADGGGRSGSGAAAADGSGSGAAARGGSAARGGTTGSGAGRGGSGASREVCDGKDNDGNGITDDVDAQGDGVCDCLNIATIGEIGPWSNGGNVFKEWLNARSPLRPWRSAIRP